MLEVSGLDCLPLLDYPPLSEPSKNSSAGPESGTLIKALKCAWGAMKWPRCRKSKGRLLPRQARRHGVQDLMGTSPKTVRPRGVKA